MGYSWSIYITEIGNHYKIRVPTLKELDLNIYQYAIGSTLQQVYKSFTKQK